MKSQCKENVPKGCFQMLKSVGEGCVMCDLGHESWWVEDERSLFCSPSPSLAPHRWNFETSNPRTNSTNFQITKYIILLLKGKENGSNQWLTYWHKFQTQLHPQNWFLLFIMYQRHYTNSSNKKSPNRHFLHSKWFVLLENLYSYRRSECCGSPYVMDLWLNGLIILTTGLFPFQFQNT